MENKKQIAFGIIMGIMGLFLGGWIGCIYAAGTGFCLSNLITGVN